MDSLMGKDMNVSNVPMQMGYGTVMRPQYSPMSGGQMFMQDLRNDPGQLLRNILEYFRMNPQAAVASPMGNSLLNPTSRIGQINEAVR